MKPRRANGSRRTYDPLSNLVFSKSQGEFVWDVQGNKYLDLICGYSACNLGHAHPKLTAAAIEQLSELTWAHGGESIQRQSLEETLARLWDEPHGLSLGASRHTKVWLTVSGARANEIAWKLAHENTPGPVVHFDLAYHGRSLATAFISDTQRSEAIGNLCDSKRIQTIPFPCHLQGTCGDVFKSISPSKLCDECKRCLEIAKQVLQDEAIRPKILFIEPAIGARGYYFAPATFLQELVRIARNYSMTIISDEIQMGLRRTGPMFLCRAQGWEPDLLVVGKSLGGGIAPIAAVIADARWIDAIPPGIESETFAGYPLACRLANETLAILEPANLAEAIERKGDVFRKTLRGALPDEITIQGAGLATCVGLENLPGEGVSQAKAMVESLAAQGVLIHLTGPKRNRLAAIPSLLIPESSLKNAADHIVQAFRSITA